MAIPTERIELFGFELSDTKKQKEIPSPIPKELDDGTELPIGGRVGFIYENDQKARNEQGLIRQYRDMARYPEADAAITDIINESFVVSHIQPSVTLRLDLLNVPERVKDIIRKEFQETLHLLKFQRKSYDIYRQWYIDGRLYFQIIVDEKDLKSGIKELRPVDAAKVKRNVIPKVKKDERTGVEHLIGYDEFFEYSYNNDSKNAVKLSKDSIIFAPSGEVDRNKKMIIGHLDKAIKPFNNLRAMEDSLIVYRIARAPERRIFYVDVGQMPKVKAEQYIRDMMNRYKNKVDYDPTTGDIRDTRKYQAMLEDFWLPRRDGSSGTEITTLPGGDNLGQIEDVQYFREKLYQSLNVPISRMNQDNSFQLGRASDIGRDEVKFSKFIARLRRQFGELFNEILKTNMVLKGICSQEEFEEMRQYITYDYLRDSHFDELKNLEILTDRINVLRDVSEHVGKYFSIEYIRKTVLGQTEEDIARIDAEIMQEIEREQIKSQEEIEGGAGQSAWESVQPEGEPIIEDNDLINNVEEMEDEMSLADKLVMEQVRYELENGRS